MKKFIPFILVIFALIAYIIFSKSGGNNYDIESAKQALQSGQNTSKTINAGDVVLDNEVNNNATIAELSKIIAEGKNYIIEKITDEQYINISTSNLDTANFSGETEIAITGDAELDVTSIQVDFSNARSDFPNDSYTLQSFTSGEAPFQYKPSPLFKVLDFGENIYIFTAKTPTGESKTKLTIITNGESEGDNTVVEKKEPATAVSGSMKDIQFPKGNFGEAIVSNETTAYYSDVKGLEISKTGGLSATICEASGGADAQHSITKFLLGKYSSWVYWNTCRATVNGKGISFYVIRLVGDDNYKYEKHYIDYNNGLHGIQELESGTGVTKENIREKNTELKSKSFDITSITDGLFKQIITDNS